MPEEKTERTWDDRLNAMEEDIAQIKALLVTLDEKLQHLGQQEYGNSQAIVDQGQLIMDLIAGPPIPPPQPEPPRPKRGIFGLGAADYSKR